MEIKEEFRFNMRKRKAPREPKQEQALIVSHIAQRENGLPKENSGLKKLSLHPEKSVRSVEKQGCQ